MKQFEFASKLLNQDYKKTNLFSRVSAKKTTREEKIKESSTGPSSFRMTMMNGGIRSGAFFGKESGTSSTNHAQKI
jgi:hypothetical protein